MSEIVNPYIAGAPVTEQRMFFGRQDIFQWIENSMAGQYADHILVIHGQRRVGKTSVLKQLGNQLPKRFIPVFFDLQGRTHTTLDHFLWWLAREIVRVLKQERGLDVPPPDKGAFSADPETFENQFLAGLRSTLGKDTLLLTFDEFDNLEESEVKEELARPLIDYLRRMMGEANLNFIFSIGSSGRKLENMQAAYTEFFKAALYKKISFLSEEQTHLLVTRPVDGILEYERAAVEHIYSVTSGHPYFTQLTCHELFARCQRTEQRKIAKADVEAILDDVVERGTVNLKFVWDEASDIEKWGLTALAQLDKTDNRLVAEYLRKNRVRFSETDLTSGLLHLREKDVLTPDNRFIIHLMRLWLQKNRPIERAREELTEANPIANRFIEIGLEFRDSGDYEKSIEYFRQAQSVSPDNLQAQVNIALSYAAQGLLDQAVIEFEKALIFDDEDVASRAGLCEAHLALGDAALQKGRMKEAAKSYQRVLAINEEHTEARQRMAEMTRQRAEKALADGRDEEALEAFTKALKYTPEDPALVERVEQVRVEKKAKAVAALVANSEKEVKALNWEAAIKILEEASTLSPEEADIQNRLAKARQSLHAKKLADLKAQAQGLADVEKFNEALEAWQAYLSMEPGDQEQVESAIAHINQEQELFDIYTNASRAIASRDFDLAIRLLKEVINRDENYKDASRLLTRAIELRRTAPRQMQSEPQKKPKRIQQPRTPSVGKSINKSVWIIGGLAAVVIIVLGVFLGPKLLGGILSNTTPTLSGDSASPEPAGTITPVPLEIIQDYITNTPPDFKDDFSSADPKWGNLSGGLSVADFLKDGYLNLILEAGTNSGKLVLGGPNIEASQFVLEFDFFFEGGSGATGLAVGFPSLRDDINCDVWILMEERNWSIGLSDRTIDHRGELVEILEGQWAHLQVVYSGDQVVAFLNDKLLGSAEGISHLGNDIWIVATTTKGGAKVWLDNVEFWNLDNFISSPISTKPAQTITPVSYETIIAYITNTPPDFQDDFSSDKWGEMAQGLPVADSLYDGSLMLNLEVGTNSEKLVLGGSNIEASQFVLEFDFFFDGSTGGSNLGVGFLSLSYGTNFDTTVNLEEQEWSLGLSDGTPGSSGEIHETLLGQWAHLQVFYADARVSAFLNGKLLGSVEGISHLGNDIWIAAVTGGQAKVWLDNINFWNIDELNSSSVSPESASTALPTAAASIPIPEIEPERLLLSLRMVLSDPTGIPSLSWSASGTHLGISSNTTRVDIIDIPNREVIQSINSDYPIKAAVWFPGKLWITRGDSTGRIWLCDYTQVAADSSCPGIVDFLNLDGTGEIVDLQYTVDGKQLIAGTNQGYLAAWRKEGEQWVLIRRDQVDNAQIYAIDWNPDGTQYLIVSKNNGLQIWDTTLAIILKQYDYTSNSAGWSPDGRYIALEDRSLRDGKLYLEVITPEGAVIARTQTEGFIHKVAWSPDGSLLATAGGDGQVLLWAGLENDLLKPVLQLNPGSMVTEVAWSPDGMMLAAGLTDGSIRVWKLEGLDLNY